MHHITTQQVNELDELRQLISSELNESATDVLQYALAAYPKKQQAELELAMLLLDGPTDETS